ncbi:hypothetical protein Cni_G06896 [Canna indica]|uniref:Uncharacterized protein n=1 Tax=Canna indica TaxID=4628 RepID=A0AAQ3K167_9LILI|nr:hypothetical protein Cni_G06896 [Canna indica]
MLESTLPTTLEQLKVLPGFHVSAWTTCQRRLSKCADDEKAEAERPEISASVDKELRPCLVLPKQPFHDDDLLGYYELSLSGRSRVPYEGKEKASCASSTSQSPLDPPIWSEQSNTLLAPATPTRRKTTNMRQFQIRWLPPMQLSQF